MADLWNSKLNRENIADFYNETVVMVYSSVMNITKETTRAEQAIIKSYLDIYARRNEVNAEDVIFVFGDILLKNANDIVEQSPLPESITFVPKELDEYTGNYMMEKILNKIDSKGYKVAEFISSDVKKNKTPGQLRKINDLFPISPLLIMEVVILALFIFGVSYVSITYPYKNKALVKEKEIFNESTLQEQFMAVMDHFPVLYKTADQVAPSETTAGSDSSESSATDATENTDNTENTENTDNTAAPESTDATDATDASADSSAESTTEPEVSATSG